MSTHLDDEVVIQANNFIKGGMTDDPIAIDLVRQLLNRIGEKKVEIRGLEGQVATLKHSEELLQKRVDDLEVGYTHPELVPDLNWGPPDNAPHNQEADKE